MNYRLIRQAPVGNAVRGKLYKVVRGQELFLCNTLENAEYIIPAAKYTMVVTESPKFKRLMPLVCQVPGRSGIRFHRGTKPEHSRGCILVSAAMEQELTARWLALQASNEPIKIQIENEQRETGN